jgi:hypothetical protein
MGAYLTLHKYDNKFYEINQIKNEGSPLLAQNEVRADIFSGTLAVFRNRKPRGECWRVMVPNAAFSNWRCAFEKIRTNFAQNL